MIDLLVMHILYGECINVYINKLTKLINTIILLSLVNINVFIIINSKKLKLKKVISFTRKLGLHL